MVWMTLSSVGVRVQAHLFLSFSSPATTTRTTNFTSHVPLLSPSLVAKDGAGRGRVAEDAAQDRRGGRGVPVRLRCADVIGDVTPDLAALQKA